MIDFYTWKTGNGFRVAIALEEANLAYRVFPVNLTTREQKHPDFLSMNPLGRIPVIVDTDGPQGTSITLSQSTAILLYIAEKCGLLLSKALDERAKEMQWLSMIITDLVAPINMGFVI